MIVEFGFFALLVGLIFSIYSLVLSLYTLKNPQKNFIQSAKVALYVVTFSVCISSIILFYSLLTHDFSVRYVYRNSAIDMPIIYVFTAFWSSLEGSHLLWTTLISSMMTISLSTVRFRNSQLFPGLIFVYSLVSTFMLLLNVWASAPLTRMFPEGAFGLGMNPLLQNPYMAAHPPSLFTGYSALVVPFAYAVSALCLGRFTPEWFVSVRRWLIFAWSILTVGIFLGGKWAYVELGWAGYWAWDPVENSSFMPWLASTAGIHSLIVLEKLGRLPRLTLGLLSSAFFLTFLGTFITRSGIISSVHSFAESDIGPAYLIFIIILLLVSFGLISFKGHHFQTEGTVRVWSLSRESTLLFTNFFLIFLLGLVLVGTLLPLVIEAINGVRISIQQPFYNAFAPWVGIGLVSIIGIGNVLKWHKGGLTDPWSALVAPALWSMLIGTSLVLRKGLDLRSSIGMYMVIWSCGVLIMGLVIRLREARWNGYTVWKFQRGYLGSLFAHLGFLLAVFGFLGNYRTVDADAKLSLGSKTEFFGYTFQNNGLTFEEGSNVKLVGAMVATYPTQRPYDTVVIKPVRSRFSNKEEWLNEIGVYSNFWFDVYLILNHFDFKTQEIHLKIHINPTVKIVWTSLVVMVFGALISLSQNVRRRRQLLLDEHFIFESAKENSQGVATPLPNLTSKIFGILLICLIKCCFLFGFSGYALAQQQIGENSNASLLLLDPKLKEIGEELRCPTCQGVSMLESTTPQSIAMKKEIERQLSEGKSKTEILSFFEKRYGEWILRKPSLSSKIGFWFWLIPCLGLVMGPIVMLILLKQSQNKIKNQKEYLREQILEYVKSEKQNLKG